MRKLLLLTPVLALIVGCGASADEEQVNVDAAKRAQSKFEASGSSADSGAPKGGSEASAVGDN